jgi:UTP--glucose-1-phosphate uridylyltransferase
MYDIGNTVEWIKSSLEVALQDPAVKDELLDYMKKILN